MSESTNLIDCDAEPMIPEGWSIHPEDQIGSRVVGQFEFKHLARIYLFLAECQKPGWLYIEASRKVVGYKLKQVLEGRLILPANILDYLVKHPEFVCDSWKWKWVSFWGTIYRTSKDRPVVRYLYFDGRGCTWDYYYLDCEWGDNCPAAVLPR